MPKWLKDNIVTLISLIPWAGGLVVAFLAWLQHQPWYLIALGAIAAIALAFLGINQINILRERTKKKITKMSDREIEDTIRGWVNIPDYRYRLSDMQIDGAYFVFELEDSVGRPVFVTRNKKDPQNIRIWSDLSIFPGVIGKQGVLEDDVKKSEQFIKDNINKIVPGLALEILRLGCQYVFNKEHGVVRLVNDVCLDDDLNDSKFINQCMFVTRAMTLVQLVYVTILNDLGVKAGWVDMSGSQSP